MCNPFLKEVVAEEYDMVGRKILQLIFLSISASCDRCDLVYVSHCFIIVAGYCVTHVLLRVRPCGYGVSRSVFNF